MRKLILKTHLIGVGVLIVLGCLILNLSKATGDDIQSCPIWGTNIQQVKSLPGVIYYTANGTTGISIIKGENLNTISLYATNDLYESHSLDGKWFITSRSSRKDQGIYDLWLHSTNLKQERYLTSLPASALYFDGEWEWLAMDRLVNPLDGTVIDFTFSPVKISKLPIVDYVGRNLSRISYNSTVNKELVFDRETSHYSVYDILTRTLNNLPYSRVLRGPLQTVPQWSNDGQLVYALSLGIDPILQESYQELFVTNSVDGITEEVSNFQSEFGSVQLTQNPIWSPDNKHLAFRMLPLSLPHGSSPYEASTLSVFDLRTRELTDLCVRPDSKTWSEEYFWSPDSRYLVFLASNGSYDSNLYVVDIETKVISRIRDHVSILYGWG